MDDFKCFCRWCLGVGTSHCKGAPDREEMHNGPLGTTDTQTLKQCLNGSSSICTLWAVLMAACRGVDVLKIERRPAGVAGGSRGLILDIRSS